MPSTRFSRSFDASWSEAPDGDPKAQIDDWRPGAPLRSAFASGLGGAVGGVAFLFVSDAVARSGKTPLDVMSLVAAAAHYVGVTASSSVAIPFSAACGALFGALCGLLTLRATRFSGRLLFFSILAPVAWIFVQAFVIRRLAPWTAEGLPFGPFVAGAAAFAVCMAFVPPIPGKRKPRKPALYA